MAKLWRSKLYLFKMVSLTFALALLLISTSFIGNAHASAKPASKEKIKNIGAELIVNGKVIKLVPVSSKQPTRLIAPAALGCVSPDPQASNQYISNGYAYFRFSLYIYNVCSSQIDHGTWSTQGTIWCSGVGYENPPETAANLPTIRPGAYALVQDQVPYAAVCLGDIGGIIPYLYPPAAIQIDAYTNGSLITRQAFSGYSGLYFVP